jgi:hypothetical protein
MRVRQTGAPLSGLEGGGRAGQERLQAVHDVAAPQHRRPPRAPSLVRLRLRVRRPGEHAVLGPRHEDQPPVQPPVQAERAPPRLRDAKGRLAPRGQPSESAWQIAQSKPRMLARHRAETPSCVPDRGRTLDLHEGSKQATKAF